MFVQDEQRIVLTVREHEELKSIPEPMHHVAKADLITWCEKIDLVEPEAAEQISHCRVLPDQHCTLWHICKLKIVLSALML